LYLFDTDILSHVLKRAPPPTLLTRLAAVPAEQQFTSAITVGELVYGAYHSDRPDHFLRQLEERLWPNIRILPFNRAAAETYGRLRAQLEEAGIPLAEPDL
jgi:predicted nucleic acid-binding protein